MRKLESFYKLLELNLNLRHKMKNIVQMQREMSEKNKPCIKLVKEAFGLHKRGQGWVATSKNHFLGAGRELCRAA